VSANETIYSFRITTPDHIERARTQVLKMPAYNQGALAAPSVGTFTLTDPNGTAYVSAAAVTVTSSVATYSLSSATIPATVPLGDGWLETWALTMPDGTTRTVRRTAAIALHELFPPVSLADARALHSSIDQLLKDTVDPTGQEKLEFAWAFVYRMVLALGNKPYKILNPDALFLPVLYKWLALIFNDAKTPMGDGTYKELAAEYAEAFKDAWRDTQLQYDQDEDGVATADETTRPAATPVFLSAAKTMGRWGWP
jgi:hypothetical protein